MKHEKFNEVFASGEFQLKDDSRQDYEYEEHHGTYAVVEEDQLGTESTDDTSSSGEAPVQMPTASTAHYIIRHHVSNLRYPYESRNNHKYYGFFSSRDHAYHAAKKLLSRQIEHLKQAFNATPVQEVLDLEEEISQEVITDESVYRITMSIAPISSDEIKDIS